MIVNEKMEMINIEVKDGKIWILQKEILHDIIYHYRAQNLIRLSL